MNFIEKRITNKTYTPRLITDVLFEAEAGSFDYIGVYNDATRFVENHQVKNTTLWKLFVKQYRIQPDAETGGWRGEYWGKMMRGACWIYKYTMDKELYAILLDSVRDLMTTQESSGRYSSYAQDKEFTYWDMWCRKYVLLGMQYFYDICEDEAFKAELIATMRTHLDYIIAHVGEGEGKIDILESTTHNPYTWGALNSSSILEPVVRYYNLTGEKKYLDYAKYLIDRGGSKWGNVYTLAVEGKKAPYEYPVTKAYESMSYFEGVLEYYRASGDENAKRAFLNFMDRLAETDITIIGCSGCTHELFDHSAVMQTEPSDLVKQETCVTVTLMKACYQALCLTGDAKFADIMERAGYNAMLGSINFNKHTKVGTGASEEILNTYKYRLTDEFMESIGGLTFDSYAPLYKDRRNRSVGGYCAMENGTAAYGCCACIGSAGVAIMPISSVMISKNGLTVNQFMNGSFKTRLGDANVTVTLATDYPYDGKISVKVDTDAPVSFDLAIRVPEYAKGEMTVNGEIAKANELGYTVISRKWDGTESLEIDIPLELKTHLLNGKVAVTRGAIVYALDPRNQNVNAVVTTEIAKAEKFTPHFAARDARRITFSNGECALFTDFASAGANWNEPENNLMTVWVDTAEVIKK